MVKKLNAKHYNWKKLQVYFNEYLFIHIHKTGGSSIKNFLTTGYGNQTSHMTVESIINEIGVKEYSKYKSFCVVRNPYDLIVSHYSYRTQTNRLKKMSFNDFIIKNYFKRITPQVEYLKYDNKIHCNTILRYENLVEDVGKFIKENNIDLDISNFPHTRKSRRSHYREYFTDRKMIDIVNDYYKEDFKTFNYKKIEI